MFRELVFGVSGTEFPKYPAQHWAQWEDHGPILIRPGDGYELEFGGGHPQGSLESTNLLIKNRGSGCEQPKQRASWYLIVNAGIAGTPFSHCIFESVRMDRFDFSAWREFWHDGGCIEVVKDSGSRSLLAAIVNGFIRFGEVDWSDPQPTASTISSREQLEAWH